MGTFITLKKHAGKKTASPEKLSGQYTLYDNCDICPLRVYIDLVCDDKLESLIIEGNPPIEALKQAKSALIFDYNNRFTDMENSPEIFQVQKIYTLRAKISMIVICMNLISLGWNDNIHIYLKKLGIHDKETGHIKKQLESKLRAFSIHLQKEIEDVNKKQGNDEPVTRRDFDRQLTVISKHFGYNISKNKITLAEYAAYLNEYKESINHGK